MADDPEINSMDVDNDGSDDDIKGDDNKQQQQEEDDLNLPDDLTKTTPQQQRICMKKVGIKVQQTGDTWYPIDKKWYDSWTRYTMFGKGDEDIPGGIDKLHEIDEPRPGKIDNSELIDPNNPSALKKDIQENRTHIWIHSEQWDLLSSWYLGGPALPRKVYERGSSMRTEKYICIYPQLVKLVTCDDKTGDIDVTKYETKGFPPDYTLKQMASDLEAEMDWKDDEKDDNMPYVHIWLPFGQISAIYPIDKSKAKVTAEELEKEDKERWVEIPDDYLKTKLDDIVLNQSDESKTTTNGNSNDDTNNDATTANETDNKPAKDFVIVIEYKQKSENDDEEDKWPRAKGDDWRETLQTGDILDVRDDQEKWYECLVRYVYPTDHATMAGKCIVHYIGWNIKWDEPLDISSDRIKQRHSETKGPHRPRKKSEYSSGGGYYDNSYSGGFWQNENGAPEQRGVVGLRNLGNTCFMNSTIQCLAQSPQLTEYFLKNDYMHHVNKNNPLGWNGRVAKAWAVLLHDMFSGKYRTVAPRQFKSAIGEVAPRFMGYAQQDSQELLSFLLDGLHEDLNQIENKPATAAVESNGREDKIVAMEAWKTYLKRNQSVIVDLLQGQYKSKVCCPDCGRVSVTFDPYMFLSVPLPTEKYKVIEYTFIPSDTSTPPTVYGQKMLKVADIEMFKQSVAKKHGVSKEELFVCDIWKSKIHRELRRHDSVGDINRKSDDIFVYHSARPNEKDWISKDDDADEVVAGAGDEEIDESTNGNSAGGGDEREDIGGSTSYYNRRESYQKKKNNQQFQTFVVNMQHRVIARPNYMHGGQQRFEDEPLGFPLLVTLPMRVKVNMLQIRNKLWSILKAFVVDKDIEMDPNDDKDDGDLPFVLFASWGFNQHCKITGDKEEIFDLKQRNLKFIVHFKDSKQYKLSLYEEETRKRDESAPNNETIQDEMAQRRQSRKPIALADCITAFCEKETLSENDAWYCSQCKDFKCASKKIDLWDSPDLLIIHLKRFNYTRNWRDRINTLVQFPINGLDLSPFLLSKDHANDAIYDLYAVSNHMGGMGGGHYTAYAKNLDNKKWYHLDDSRTTRVNNVDQVVGSAAYVLYYYKRNPKKIKHRASKVIIPEEITKDLKKMKVSKE